MWQEIRPQNRKEMNMAKKEVNAKFMEELKLVWGKNQDMIDYCIKEAFEIVELDNGFIFDIKKPRIETSFCYGYGQFGMSTVDEEEGASEKARAVREFENFKNANIKDNFESLLKRIEKGNYYMVQYTGGKNLVGIANQSSWHFDMKDVVGEITDNDRAKIKEACDRAIKRFEKRLETYWKRYGSSKLRVWTYLVD